MWHSEENPHHVVIFGFIKHQLSKDEPDLLMDTNNHWYEISPEQEEAYLNVDLVHYIQAMQTWANSFGARDFLWTFQFGPRNRAECRYEFEFFKKVHNGQFVEED